jgi:multicomponent K+:H+ antiporter subunit D
LSCLFLLVELMERGRSIGDDVLAVTLEAYGDDGDPIHEQEVGVATPRTLTALGIAFLCCTILIAGLPPLSGFLGKFAMLHALFGVGGSQSVGMSTGVWVLTGTLILSGLAATIALMRSGINTFWVSLEGTVPAVRSVEIAPIVLLLGLGLALTFFARPVMDFMHAAATSVYAEGDYTQAVLAGSARDRP